MTGTTRPDFEQQMGRLAAIVRELEEEDLSLERNVALYKEGKILVQSCRTLLEEARNEVLFRAGEGDVPDPLPEEETA